MTLHSEAAKEIDLEALRGHTAGPWALSYDKGSSRDVVASPDPLPICSVRISWVGNEQYAANARLIAAAPALLAELTTRRARDAEVAELVAAAKQGLRAMDDARDAIQPITGAQMKLHRLNPLTADNLDSAADAMQSALAPFTGAKPWPTVN